MLAEKLLLHVLIILSPVLIYSFVFENKKISPYMCGLMQSAAAILCMAFPVYSFGLYWDLRYVPLILSVLYGGPIAGGMVFLSIIGMRTYIGGEALIFGYVSGIVAFIIPFLLSKKFWNFSPNKRILYTVLIGCWPAIVQLGILLYWVSSQTMSSDEKVELLTYSIIFGLIHIIGIGFSAKLNEMLIEKGMMKQEIHRAEKFNTIGELAASIAHEVRNPLTVVKGFLQLMQQKEKGENYEYLTLVLSELGRAEAIINDYLNFAKPQFEKVEKFEVQQVLADVYQLLDPLAVKYGVELKPSFHSNQSLIADRDQFKQALVNVIKNAIEATNRGGNVSIELSDDRAFINIKITDTGKGMTKEQINKIGTLFYTTKDSGTGLGTMVSMRIVEAMNGKITYSSKPNVGTEVLMKFPALDEDINFY